MSNLIAVRRGVHIKRVINDLVIICIKMILLHIVTKKEEYEMLVSEIKSNRAIVCIHDDYIENEPESILNRLNDIVSDSFHRRQCMLQEDLGRDAEINDIN